MRGNEREGRLTGKRVTRDATREMRIIPEIVVQSRNCGPRTKSQGTLQISNYLNGPLHNTPDPINQKRGVTCRLLECLHSSFFHGDALKESEDDKKDEIPTGWQDIYLFLRTRENMPKNAKSINIDESTQTHPGATARAVTARSQASLDAARRGPKAGNEGLQPTRAGQTLARAHRRTVPQRGGARSLRL